LLMTAFELASAPEVPMEQIAAAGKLEPEFARVLN